MESAICNVRDLIMKSVNCHVEHQTLSLHDKLTMLNVNIIVALFHVMNCSDENKISD